MAQRLLLLVFELVQPCFGSQRQCPKLNQVPRTMRRRATLAVLFAQPVALCSSSSSSSSSNNNNNGVDSLHMAEGSSTCQVWNDVDFNGNDLSSLPTASAADCCAACSDFSRATADPTTTSTTTAAAAAAMEPATGATACSFWSWNGAGNKVCYLKSSDAGKQTIPGVVSGASANPPPAPAPAPPVPAHMPWKNTSLPIAVRAKSLVAAMTLAEKAQQLQTNAPGIPRLDLPTYSYWSEAAHGVAWAGRATVFPCSLAMAATFDVPLLRQIGHAVGVEGRAKYNDAINATAGKGTPQLYGLTFFAPNINIVRDVRWGRGQETYGEDPLLTSRLGVQLIAGMQTEYGGYPLVAATSKHYFAYNLESNFAAGGTDAQYRLRFDANVSATDLLQTYLPAFEATVDPSGESPAASVMCSYNSVNGIPACGHPFLSSHLRGTAGFEGFVVSDCGAVGWMGPSKHNYTADDIHSAALFTNAGGDVCCGGEYAAPAVEAVHTGLLNETAMDRALGKVSGLRNLAFEHASWLFTRSVV